MDYWRENKCPEFKWYSWKHESWLAVTKGRKEDRRTRGSSVYTGKQYDTAVRKSGAADTHRPADAANAGAGRSSGQSLGTDSRGHGRPLISSLFCTQQLQLQSQRVPAACAGWKGPLFTNQTASHTCTWARAHVQGPRQVRWLRTLYGHSAAASFPRWPFMHIRSAFLTDDTQKSFPGLAAVYSRPQLHPRWFDQSLPLVSHCEAFPRY